MESAVFGEGGTSQIGQGGGLSGLAERKVKNLYGVTVQRSGDAWNGVHILSSDLCWTGKGAFVGEGGWNWKKVYYSGDLETSEAGSVYAFESFAGVRIREGKGMM
jgi:hypothetical protein